RARAATGFLTAAPTEVLTVPMEEEKLRLRFNELDDMAVATMSAFLGLTLGCARCHDHKFDAIPTRDYYRLQCAFTTTTRANVVLATRAEAASDRLEKQRGAVPRSRPRRPLTALAIIDKRAEPEPTWLLERGDFYKKKERLQVGFLTVL